MDSAVIVPIAELMMLAFAIKCNAIDIFTVRNVKMNPPPCTRSFIATSSTWAVNPRNENTIQLRKIGMPTCSAQSIKQSLEWVINGEKE